MKGDFSRDTFDKTKHYAGVLMQQGRVQTDADWNEQWAVDEYRETTTDYDVIGACGAPIHDAGFGLGTTDGKTLTIGKGRFYADGILVENDADVLYDAQPHLPNPPPILELLKKADAVNAIVYLDVWLRHITTLDDPLIREVALGGPDTTTRAQVVWQVRVLPVKARTQDSENCAELRATRANLEAVLKKLQETDAGPERIAAARARLDEVERRLAAECGSVSCDSAFDEWTQLVAPRNAALNARTVTPTDDDNPCLLPPSAGYQRLENQLYRVEIHRGGEFKAGAQDVTFKASRDNGTVVTLIDKVNGQEITVQSIGPDDVLGFANGQWVELLDDTNDLNATPGELVQIDTVNAATRVIKLKSAPTLTFDAARHPKLRRWDTVNEVPLSTDWIALEGGIQIQFAEADYRTGDYWLIPARTATGEIEWSPFEIPNTAPIAQPPRGIVHHYCRLALVGFVREQLAVTDDCRLLFPPLTEVGGKTTAPALHVTATNWANDEVMEPDVFLKLGLDITLDAAPEAFTIQEANVIVTIEVSLGTNESAFPFSVNFILDGDVSVNADSPNVIQWRPTANVIERLRAILDRPTPIRVRVTLKGHTIWSDAIGTRRYLDGQAFGTPAQRVERVPRIALEFPSGDGVRASDFESWFYLGRARVPSKPLQIDRIRFLRLSGAPSSAGDISLPPVPEGVGFKADESVNVIEIRFNRPVRRDGIEVADGSSSIRVEPLLRGLPRGRFPGNVRMVDAQTAQFIARDPQIFPPGAYRLTVLGTDQTDAPAVRAVDDGAVLDGNYDNAAGQDFVMPFTAF